MAQDKPSPRHMGAPTVPRNTSVKSSSQGKADLPGFNLQGEPGKSLGLMELSHLRGNHLPCAPGMSEQESNYTTHSLAGP